MRGFLFKGRNRRRRAINVIPLTPPLVEYIWDDNGFWNDELLWTQ